MNSDKKIPGPYSSVVFAGGGNRCVWQIGFWSVAAPALELRPRVAAGVSAGAFMACVALSGRIDWGLEYYLKVTEAIDRNVQWSNLWRGEPLFPHPAVYRKACLEILNDQALTRLKQGPEIRVLLARPPAWAGSLGGVLAGFLAYTLEKHLKGPLHPRWSLALGFRPETNRVADCADSRELAELILASSCTPPVLPRMRRNGRPVLDGGLIDNAPTAVLAPADEPALVLLSRRYSPAKLRNRGGLTYIQPSRDPLVGKWDYTDPEGFLATYRLGREDARRFVEQGPRALQV